MLERDDAVGFDMMFVFNWFYLEVEAWEVR